MKRDEVYKHFRGNEYKIIGTGATIAPGKLSSEQWNDYLYVCNGYYETDCERVVILRPKKDEHYENLLIVRCNATANEKPESVVYIGTNKIVWVRNKEIFEEMIGSVKRFEKIN